MKIFSLIKQKNISFQNCFSEKPIELIEPLKPFEL
jgi:hypothetical protein